MNLPPALAPWTSALDLFPNELIVPLGALARPIDALIGPLRDRQRQGDGEPDGYADIARRGPYERLLLSEWLLASEEPDEWTRRAVMGEHSFLEISRRKPVADRLAVALFDTGPSQWGSARLAHLAALIVLQQRARTSGARFAWGILQHTPPPPDAASWSDVTEAGVLRLTQGVASREATQGDFVVWRERFALSARTDGVGSPASPPEAWVVGRSRLAPLATKFGASLLTVSEPDDFGGEAGESRFLIANAHFGPQVTPRTVASDVRLPLPAPNLCVRLLRDPFGVRIHNPAAAGTKKESIRERLAPASDLQFSLYGSKLFARGGARGGTTLLAYPMGNSPVAGVTAPPKEMRSQFGIPFFAAGRIGKVTILASLTSDGTHIRIETFGKGKGFPPGSYRLTAAATSTEVGERLMPLVPLYRADRFTVAELVTVLPDGRLLRLRSDDEESGKGEGSVLGLRCLALHRASKGVMFVGATGSGSNSVARYLLHDTPLPDGETMERIDIVADFEFGSVFLGGINDGPVVVQDTPSFVTVRFGGNTYNVSLPKGQQPVGIGWNRQNTTPLLFLLSEDRKTISTMHAYEPDQPVPLLQTPGTPITRFNASPYARLIAFATEVGEVAVWAMDYRDYVYRRVLTQTLGE